MNCQAKNKQGEPCGAAAMIGDEFCYQHSPKVADERAEARKLGGYRSRRKHSNGQAPAKVRTIEDVLKLLEYSLSETLELENSIARGRLLVALADSFIKALDVGDLETRMQRLEDQLNIR